MNNYHIPTSKERDMERKKDIQHQVQDICEFLLDLLIEKQNRDSDINLFSMYIKENSIEKAISRYTAKNTLILSYSYYYYEVLKKYDTIANKAKKYYKNEVANRGISIEEIKAISQANDKLCREIWGNDYNKPKKEKKNGIFYFILGLILK